MIQVQYGGFEFFFYYPKHFLSFVMAKLTWNEMAREWKKKITKGSCPELSGIFIPSEGEILYLNFLSYADLYLGCCVSLVLRGKSS